MHCRLIYGCDRDANVRYLLRMRLGDPYAVGKLDSGEVFVIGSKLEHARLVANTRISRVFCTSDYPEGEQDVASVLAAVLEELGVDSVTVPFSFPAYLYIKLGEKLGFSPDVSPSDAVLDERAVKTAEELQWLEAAQDATSQAQRLVRSILARCAINDEDDTLRDPERGGGVLTCESVRAEVGGFLHARGYDLPSMILQCGDACLKVHDEGSGPVRPHQLIVCDIFPRSRATGYWGDMTRTFLRGRAGEEQRRLVDTVMAAHDFGVGLVAPGFEFAQLTKRTKQFFDERGYPSEKRGDVFVGFCHGLSHGVGLDIHEAPQRLDAAGEPCLLRAGHVLTVEPGLYYPGVGGCRWEDMYRISPETGAATLISSCPYDWEIP